MFTGEATNAVDITKPLGDYELMCAMLIPMYAARATEEAFFGPRGVTLATASDVRPLRALHWLPLMLVCICLSMEMTPMLARRSACVICNLRAVL